MRHGEYMEMERLREAGGAERDPHPSSDLSAFPSSASAEISADSPQSFPRNSRPSGGPGEWTWVSFVPAPSVTGNSRLRHCSRSLDSYLGR